MCAAVIDDSTFKNIVGENIDDPKYLLAYAFHKREVIKETEKYPITERPKKRATLKHTLLTDDRKADNLDKAETVLKKGAYNYIVDNPYECLTMTVEPFLTQTVIAPNIDALTNEGIEKLKNVAVDVACCIDDYKVLDKRNSSFWNILITNICASLVVAVLFFFFSFVFDADSNRDKKIRFARYILPTGVYVVDSTNIK